MSKKTKNTIQNDNLEQFLDDQTEEMNVMACESCESVEFLLNSDGKVMCANCLSDINTILWVSKQ